METKSEMNNSIFKTMNGIGKKLKDSKLSVEVLDELAPEIQIVANYLKMTDRQAIIFTLFFQINCNGEPEAYLKDVSKYIDTDLVDILVYKKEIEILEQANILEKERQRRRFKLNYMNCHYCVNAAILEAIIENQPLPEVSKNTEMDIIKFVSKVSNCLEDRKDETIETSELFSTVEEMELTHSSLNLVEQLKKTVLDIEDRTLFYEMCDDLVTVGSTGVNITLLDIYDNVRLRMRKSCEIMEMKNQLFELDLVQLEEGRFFSDAKIKLTDKAKVLFLGEDVTLFLKESKTNNLIRPEKIAAKTLFFDEGLNRQVSFLQQSLEQTSFVNLQNRMEEKALPKGVAAIFYGSPGTGKTETVYQLAKQTGRAILHVDISQSKSMWFGESEKKIKEIFTNYKKLCKTEELKPILLFNEADAIFGRRKDGNASNVAQTENAMQNIILEEMEKLDGILIATTNLNQNLDAAFERRFLFKVEFTKPTAEAKQKIWQSKLPWMKDEDAQTLAARYSFSGGEIDNIVRKATMEEVLNGSTPNFPQIITFCEGEKFSGKGTVKLGF